jgi:amicyanin
MMIRIRNVAVALLLVGTVAACGSSSSGGSPSPGSGSSGTSGSGHTVAIQGFAFKPATLTVKAGTKVTFTNDDSTPHTATSSGSSTINSGSLSKGQTYTVTFTKPGTYNYICTFHQFMHGTVIVQ